MLAAGIIVIVTRDETVITSKLNLFQTNILFRPITTGKIKGKPPLRKSNG